MRPTIEYRFKELDKLIVAASDKNLDAQLASYLCRLGAVLICGNIERCVEIVISDRLNSRSPPQVAGFLKSYFKRGTNYDCEEIKALLFRFDSDWGRAFESYVANNDQVRESISSCYAVRNPIAHGASQSLGPSALKQYFNASFDLVANLEHVVR